MALFPATGFSSPPTVDSKAFDGGRLVTLTVPGTVLDMAEAGRDESCHGLLILTRSGESRTLYHYDPSAPDTLETLDGELPPEADALAVADLDGDGRSDVLVGEPGRLHRLGTLDGGLEIAAPELLLESPSLDLEMLDRRGFLEPGRLAVPELGTLKVFAPGAGGLRLVEQHDLPLRARRESTGLRLYSYPVHPIRVDGRTLHVVGPEAHGNRRVRTVLIDPRPGGETESEAWSWLPSPESIVDSWYAALNGRPALIVTTVKADHLGIFEKKKVRVFSLRTGDRSRSGSNPSLKAETVSHQWQDADPNFVDADGDGKVDLVLVQPEGLGGKKLVVEGYLGRSNAQFQPIAWRSVIPARHADAWRYGHDVDGDGVPDLVTRSDELVQVFRGVRNAKKKQLLEKKPRWTIDFAAGTAEADDDDRDDEDRDDEDWDGEDWEGTNSRARLEVRDLDRDGRAEVLVRSEGSATSTVHVVTLDAP